MFRPRIILCMGHITYLHNYRHHQPSYFQDVCRCLGAGSTTDAVQLCCCSDQLSDPAKHWDVTPDALSRLTTWWQHRMACTMDTVLTDDLYLDIMAR